MVFQHNFFQKYWDVCGEEVIKVAPRIVEGVENAECINNTYLVLIPKVKSPTSLTKFCPISLCNVLYKTAPKVAANRLKESTRDYFPGAIRLRVGPADY